MVASGLAEEAKATLGDVMKQLGGRFSLKMNASCTHLVLQWAYGPKFDACSCYAVKPVTVDWLVDSARAGAPRTKSLTTACKEEGPHHLASFSSCM